MMVGYFPLLMQFSRSPVLSLLVQVKFCLILRILFSSLYFHLQRILTLLEIIQSLSL